MSVISYWNEMIVSLSEIKFILSILYIKFVPLATIALSICLNNILWSHAVLSTWNKFIWKSDKIRNNFSKWNYNFLIKYKIFLEKKAATIFTVNISNVYDTKKCKRVTMSLFFREFRESNAFLEHHRRRSWLLSLFNLTLNCYFKLKWNYSNLTQIMTQICILFLVFRM